MKPFYYDTRHWPYSKKLSYWLTPGNGMHDTESANHMQITFSILYRTCEQCHFFFRVPRPYCLIRLKSDLHCKVTQRHRYSGCTDDEAPAVLQPLTQPQPPPMRASSAVLCHHAFVFRCTPGWGLVAIEKCKQNIGGNFLIGESSPGRGRNNLKF